MMGKRMSCVNKKEGILGCDLTLAGFNLVFLLHFGGSLEIFRLSWICVFKGMNGEPLGGCGGSQQPWWGLGEGEKLGGSNW